MPPDTTLRIELQADGRAVRAALAAAMQMPGLRRGGAGQRADAELVLAEVLNNIVEHAYGGQVGGGQGGGGRITLSLRLAGGWLACRVVDHGRPMPQGRLPDAPPPQADGRDGALPQGGFGWPLIRGLTGALRYRRAGGRNILLLTLPLDRAAPVDS